MIFDVLGAVLWVGLYVGLGYVLHDQLAEAARLAHRAVYLDRSCIRQ